MSRKPSPSEKRRKNPGEPRNRTERKRQARRQQLAKQVASGAAPLLTPAFDPNPAATVTDPAVKLIDQPLFPGGGCDGDFVGTSSDCPAGTLPDLTEKDHGVGFYRVPRGQIANTVASDPLKELREFDPTAGFDDEIIGRDDGDDDLGWDEARDSDPGFLDDGFGSPDDIDVPAAEIKTGLGWLLGDILIQCMLGMCIGFSLLTSVGVILHWIGWLEVWALRTTAIMALGSGLLSIAWICYRIAKNRSQ